MHGLKIAGLALCVWGLSGCGGGGGGGGDDDGQGYSDASLDGTYYAVYFSNETYRESAIQTLTFDGKGGGSHSTLLSTTDPGAPSTSSGSVRYAVNDAGEIKFQPGVDETEGRLNTDGTAFVAARAVSAGAHNIAFGVKAATSGHSSASLSGAYAFATMSVFATPNSGLGTISFDGAANYAASGTFKAGDAAASDQTASGTYAVNADGTGTATDDADGSVTQLWTSADGKAVVGARVDDPDIQSITVAFKVKTNGYSPASLKGVYYATTLGIRTGVAPDAAIVKLTFNGSGSVTFEEIYSDRPPSPAESGTYAVADDGTLTLGTVFRGRISADGRSFLMIRTDAGTHVLMVGVRQ